ncbi:MAG: hypothetical protein IJL82_04600 [Prevotella sp.]|nr:hypothetical protein [Prevotella sp.]
MSTNTIQMYVNIKKNNVSTSTGFGKYYLNADTNETLSNDGLVNHIMHHNCAVGREAIAAVIKKLGECIPELVAQGQPVKIEGLGTFYPTAESSPILLNKLLDVKYNPLDALKGIHLRFKPQSDSLNDLTSRSYLKMQVSPVINLVTDRVQDGVDAEGKKKYKTLRCSLQEFRDAGGFPVALSSSNSGSGSQSQGGSSNTGGSTNTGGDNGGGDNGGGDNGGGSAGFETGN